ncbi:endolytic transglycosylase MltG [Patescibacteria group bacterium]
MRRSPKKKQTASFIVKIFFIIFVAFLSGGFWIFHNSKPVSDDKTTTSFIIRKGETIDSIGTNLKEKNLIKSQPIFKFLVMKEGIAKKIQAGSFSLSPSMSVEEIAFALTSGRQDIWITVIEGMRREEIADSLQKSFSEYGVDFSQQVFLAETTNKEGMLFPDTYLFPVSITEAEVASMLTTTLDQKLTKKMKADITAKGSTLGQILTKASLIEREAKTSSARKMVSAIIDNRLEIGMALQIDATMQYAKGFNKIHQDWWAPPLAVDKKINSPYNTYQVTGFPPGPICSPSLDSIQAAIYPNPNDYLFYITDTKGNMHYATSIEEHNSNVNTYLR